MEQKQKRKVVFTYIIASALMFVLFYGIALHAAIAGLFSDVFGFDATISVNFGLVIVSFAVLFLYWLILRNRKWKGVFSFPKSSKEVYIGLAIVMAVDVLCLIAAGLLLEGGMKTLVPPSLMTFSISLAAGVYEETSFRAIPVSVFMKNKPGSLRIYLAVMITSIGFAVAHMGNMSMGASAQITTLQVCASFVSGIFLAALYLRTGSIMLSMCFHFFHDVINLMIPAQSTGIMLQTSISGTDLAIEITLAFFELIVAFYLLRKSKHEDIKNRWAAIWAE